MEYDNNLISKDTYISIIQKILNTNEFEFIDWKVGTTYKKHLNAECTIKLNQESKVTNLNFFIKFKTGHKSEIDWKDKIEVKFYKTLNGEQRWVPRMYDYIQNQCLILEDLSTRGYMVSEMIDFDFNHCIVALKTIARLHAYGFKKLHNNQYSGLSEKSFGNGTFNNWFNRSVDLLSKILDLTQNDNELKKNFRSTCKSLYDILTNEKYPKSLCHTKLLRKNIMFKYDNEKKPICSCLINFQSISALLPTVDVFMFLYANTSSKFRECHLFELTEYYYKELSEQLEKYQLKAYHIFNKIDFESTCIDMVNFGRIICLIKTIFQETKMNDKLSHSENPFDYILHNQIDDILHELVLKHNKKMPSKMLEEIQEISTTGNITKELCFKLIKEKFKSDVVLEKFSCYFPNTRSGYLGSHKTLSIDIINSDLQPVNVKYFVKFLPEEPGQLELLELFNGFKREIITYKEIFETLKKLGVQIDTISPSCHVVGHNFILVDLLVDYKTVHKYKMFDYKHLNTMYKSLARLHAGSIIWEEKLTEQEGKRMLISEKYSGLFVECMYNNPSILKGVRNGISVVNNHLLKMIDPFSLEQKLQKLCEKIPHFTTASSNYRNVLNHGDLWSSNIMFEYSEDNEPIHCRFVDFQMGRYLPQSHDVMCSLYLTTSSEVREKHKLKLLTNYYSYFKAELQEHDIDCDSIITFEEFLQSCEEMEPFAMQQKAGYYHFIMQTAEYEKEYLASPELQNRYFIQSDRSDMIIRNCVNDIYRELILDSHIPLLNYLKTL
ncbi:uncharacterized protein LOC123305628 [Chrysoperla carnea]|uniref:uncharacterized protein LOC123305628 n=1 Tax=Chrysoperla carnea TaxID=189513 RepID=UPI001D0785EF|nr:uncharacterized protein LOC123305628 [Chrysoperla carnea]